MFSADEAEAQAQLGDPSSCAGSRPAPNIHGMHAARGILTTRGGMTSHAAVVARGMGRACVAGAGDLRVDYKAQTVPFAASRSRPAIWSPSTARPAK